MKIEINGKDVGDRPITVVSDKYGIGQAVEAVALLGFIAFVMLFVGECSGCVKVISCV